MKKSNSRIGNFLKTAAVYILLQRTTSYGGYHNTPAPMHFIFESITKLEDEVSCFRIKPSDPYGNLNRFWRFYIVRGETPSFSPWWAAPKDPLIRLLPKIRHFLWPVRINVQRGNYHPLYRTRYFDEKEEFTNQRSTRNCLENGAVCMPQRPFTHVSGV